MYTRKRRVDLVFELSYVCIQCCLPQVELSLDLVSTHGSEVQYGVRPVARDRIRPLEGIVGRSWDWNAS